MVPDSAERIYDEVTDLAHLTQQMEGWVDREIAAELINAQEHWRCLVFSLQSLCLVGGLLRVAETMKTYHIEEENKGFQLSSFHTTPFWA